MLKLEPSRSLTLILIWQIVAAVFVVAGPSQLIFGNSLWLLSDKETTFLFGIFIAYLASALLVTLSAWKARGYFLVRALGILLAVFGGYFFWILITKSYYTRPLIVSSVALSVVLVILPFFLRPRRLIGFIGILAVVVLATQAAEDSPRKLLDKALGLGPKPTRSVSYLDSAFYRLKATRFNRYFENCDTDPDACSFPRNGGGVSNFGDGYLLSDGEGLLYYFELSGNTEKLLKTDLPYRIPINSEDFIAAGHETSVWLFRVMDILVQERGDKARIFASHHYWKPEQNCFVVRVSSAEVDTRAFQSGKAVFEWKTLYETKPCLPTIRPYEFSHSDRLFSGDESGGRMGLVAEDQLLLTVGDHLFNGYDKGEMLAQDSSADYGKTILIDTDSGASEVFTLGHRNPQGLYIDPDRNIWSTEHGPRGGDELNLLLQGKNYGWPLVTYGTDYGKHVWPLNEHQGNHLGYQRPLYAWVPSIATSNLIGVEKDLFGLWHGDLLVGAYSKQLSRVRIREGRVVYVEPIQIGRSNSRIRDLIEDKQGRIILWLDGGSVAVLEPREQAKSASTGDSTDQSLDGEALFVQCSGCHAIQDGASHGAGPDLFGIYQKRIASAESFNYSQALLAKSGSWDEDNLDRYLENPAHFAPGTAMQFPGIKDAGQRARLIEFLKSRQ